MASPFVPPTVATMLAALPATLAMTSLGEGYLVLWKGLSHRIERDRSSLSSRSCKDDESSCSNAASR